MDVVLEVFDTLAFDRMYSTLLPAFTQPEKPFTPHGTYSSMRQMPTSSYTYEPASQFLPSFLEPSDFINMSSWPRNHPIRQLLSLYLITTLFGAVIYFVFATLSYYFVFDKAAFSHPKYIKGQIPMEIRCTVASIPWIALLTVPFFWLEVRGYSKMYDSSAEGPGRWYDILQFPIFIAFTDFFIYWIHRGLHHPTIYKRLHKAHHKWVVPTPFASHAFHPLDGFSQSLPYHIYPFLFPLNKLAYVALFVFVNLWTVTIHDGEYAMNSVFINGAACHTMHHLYFNYNYGQFTTLWDRLGGSYRKPNEELFRRDEKMSDAEWKRQAMEAEAKILDTEGHDERDYDGESTMNSGSWKAESKKVK